MNPSIDTFAEFQGLAPASILLPALVSLLVSVLACPTLIWLAPRIGLIDSPDGHRKLQSQGIPLGGGLAILLAMTLTLSIMAFIDPTISRAFQVHQSLLIGFISAVGIVAVVGIIDDWLEIRGRQKLMGQVIAVGLVACSGLAIPRIALLGNEVELGILAIPFTMAWLLAAINAVNLIDGIDGLAGTISLIVAISIALLAGGSQNSMEALLAWVLAGAIAGFLCFNWHPAKIYLGDAGSMSVGLILGVLAIRVSLKGATTAGLAVPLVIWAVMFFDVAMAILRRRLTGQSIYATDRAHFHHVLQQHGYTVIQVVGIIGGACAACCLGVLFSAWMGHEWISVVNATLVLGFIVASGLFGRREVALFLRRFSQFFLSLCRLPGQKPAALVPVESRFHGQFDWDPLWQELVEYAERFDLYTLQLNVSAPMIGEEYHAQWHRKQSPTIRESWRTEIPLVAGPVTIGRLIVSGQKQSRSGVDCIVDVVEGLKPFQIQLEEMLLECLPVHSGNLLRDANGVQTRVAHQLPNRHDSNLSEISPGHADVEIGQAAKASLILNGDAVMARTAAPKADRG